MQWMIQAPDKIALREQIGRIVLTEWDQKEARQQHEVTMQESKKMHRQIQRIEYWSVGIAVVLGAFSILEFFGWSYKSSTSQTPAPPSAVESLSAPVDASKNRELQSKDESTTQSPAPKQQGEPPKKSEE